ncbi:MAG: hypothetical protein WDN75_13595 [Bacteroidota bacterium]
MKLGIGDSKGLKTRILNGCSNLDMKAMADDVAPFLFNPAEAKKVELFEKYLTQVKL